MIWRWVLGILTLLILLLCRTRAGVLVTLKDTVRVDVKLGWLRFQIVPGKKEAPKTKKPKREKGKRTKAGRKKKSFPKPSLADIQDVLKTLGPPLKKALNRTRRGIRIDPLCLSLVIGGQEDPAAAGKLYGEINAAVWTGMPVLEQLLDIPTPRIHTEADFDAEKTRAEGTLGITIRIGTALAIGFGIAVPALRWFLRYMRKHRKKQLSAPEESGVRAA
ncbi:DUF2953 domain-containing protein [uncultured Oscillibacter sp.]|uniref:DUF2953 domain-containing protein n=1 Tax=uncultured Oscillibacter sp. TaxID=876091 RepID=UPI0025F548C7|nr:DUF2953 domain-containing protein [uncultured Oscillibacter sp.]MCX4371094.1 DUF2953 domain-containing protein [Dysosmobacter sp.]